VTTLFSDIMTIVRRDVIRSFRQKSQLYGSIARPLIWLFLLGNGLRNSFAVLPGNVNYVQFIFPGMLVMNVLFASIMAGTSVIWDREFGFLKEIMVAPVTRVAIVVGKTVSGSVTALLQGTIVLALFPLLGLRLSPLQIALAILGMWLTSLAICSLGVLIASRMTSFEGFGTVNNFLVMPLFFLSGAMYPIHNLPGWLKALVHANPVTYSVNLLRGVILRLPGDHLLGISVILVFTLLVSAVSVFLFTLEGTGR